MTDPVTMSVENGVALVVFDRPPVNAWNKDMTDGLRRVLGDVRATPEIRVVILTGAGERAFSAGSDIVEFSALLDPGAAVEKKLAPQHEVFADLAALPVPTIAALNGFTLGGGLEIAVCCDLVVAEEHVSIGSPEITLGLFPSSGGTFRVARRIGTGRAKQMQLLGTPIDAGTALAWGLVNEVVPRGTARARAHELAGILLQRPQLALELCKSVIDAAFELDEPALIQRSLEASERAFTSADAAEGVRAFLNKEKPSFGRR